MPNIFISYRRDDSKAITGRIYDRLVKTFGEGNVFKDVDRIPPGSTFAEVLDAELLKCNILLVIIGRTWVNITDAQGNRRLYKEDDFVRIEVERGLNRPDLLVIPVMVDEAVVPSPSELPDTLNKLSSLQVVQVRDDPDFHRDMNRLIDFLKDHDRQKLCIRERVKRNIFLILAVFITLLVIAIISFVANSIARPPSTVTPTFDPFDAAQHLLTLTKQAEVAALATATPNYTATIEAILGSFITQTHEAETATANVYTYTSTPTVTINSTATMSAMETIIAQSTNDKLAIIQENATNDALAMANAPTNTMQPTETSTPTNIPTVSNIPTDTPVLIIRSASAPIPTNATTEAQALLNAQATLDAQITATSSIKVNAIINSTSAKRSIVPHRCSQRKK